MSRLLALAAVMALFGCGPCAAQQGGFGALPAPGSGTTSPLGAIVTTSPAGGGGIDLGMSELYVVGLSPLPPASLGGGDTCPGAITANSTPDPTNSGFGSGEVTGPVSNPTTSSPCDATTTGGVDLSAGLSSVPGSAAVSSSAVTSLGAPAIPVGATNQSVAGLSQPVAGLPLNCTGVGGLPIPGSPFSSLVTPPGMINLTFTTTIGCPTQ